MKTHKAKPIEETPVATEVDIVVLEAPDNKVSAGKTNGGGTTQGNGSGGRSAAPNGGNPSGSHGNGSAGLAPNGGGASGSNGNNSGG